MKFRSTALVFILLAAYGLEALGQTSTSGMFGTRTIGTSISPGTSTFGGTTSMGGMGMSGMSGMGMSGMSGMGMSGMSGMSGMGMSGMSGMGMSGMGMSGMGSTQSGQFIGANTGQTPFIGGGMLNQNQQTMRSQNYGQSGQFGNTRGGANQFGRANQQYNQAGFGSQYNRNQTQLPVVRRTDFEYVKITSADVSSALSQRLQNSVGKGSPSPVVATYQGNTLILRGVVATAHDRDLAGLMARMEPGVGQVQNDLVVVNKADTPDSKD